MDRHLAPRALALCATLLAGTAGAAAPTRFELSAYGGQAAVADTDLDYDNGEDTRLTLAGVSWETESFEAPIYYGLRLSHWLGHSPNLGLAVDFTHPKLYLDPAQRVQVSGTRDGLAVDQEEAAGETLQSFSNSHGLNLLTLNALYRWNPAASLDRGFRRRLQPYVGLGLGVAIPRVEAEVDGQRTDKYQLAGPVGQALLGLRYAASERIGLFAEYKFSQVWLEESLSGGGSVSFNPQVHQFVFGFSYGL